MKRAALTLALAFLGGAAVMLAVGGWAAVAKTAEIVLPVGALAVATAAAGDAGRLPLRTLRDRFQLGVGLPLAQLLLVLTLAAWLMFVSSDDAWTAVGVLVFAAVIGVSSASTLLRSVRADVAHLRGALHAVQHGERDVQLTASSCEELADVAAAANRMVRALATEEHARDQAERSRRQVIAAISHDLRTPLTSLRLVAQAIDDGLADERTTQRYLETIGANVRTLGTLIDDLFELSQLDAREVELSTRAVALENLADQTLAVLRAQADTRRVLLQSEIAPDLPRARANPDMLGRVLVNLLQNAIRNTPPDGTVVISAKQLDRALQVEVADTGPGVPEPDQPYIFEPGYRGSNQDAQGTGNGLGLAISRAIIEAHGGQIWLANGGQGTRIQLTLPIAT
jgi:signal transduction histidine kinase